MSYSAPSQDDIAEGVEVPYRRMWSTWKWALVICVAGFLIHYLLPKHKPFVNPKIVAEIYVWPNGCERKVYKELDKIRRECLVDRYKIGDGQIWGWRRTGKWPHYYRVGNDAVLVTDIWSSEATIYEVVSDVFVVNRASNGQL